MKCFLFFLRRSSKTSIDRSTETAPLQVNKTTLLSELKKKKTQTEKQIFQFEHSLKQRCQTNGLQAKTGPLEGLIRLA